MISTKEGMKVHFLFCSLALLYLFNSIPVLAGGYKLIFEDKKSGYSIADTSRVCGEYENNLKRFKYLSYGMACERKLDPELGFTRPNWVKLEPIQHTELVREIYMTRKSKPEFIEDSEKWKDYVKNETNKGELSLEVARINMGSGKDAISFVRIGTNRKCDEVQRFNSLGSPNMQKIFRVNNDLKHLAGNPEIGYGKENLILYRGRIYADHYYGVPLEVKTNMGRDATLVLYIVRENRVGQLCKYYYSDR